MASGESVCGGMDGLATLEVDGHEGDEYGSRDTAAWADLDLAFYPGLESMLGGMGKETEEEEEEEWIAL